MALTTPGRRRSRWWSWPAAWWLRSLPLRVIASVFLASVLVLVLGGFLLMQQATLGVMEGKKESVRDEARQALYAAQQQLNSADLTGDVNVDNLLTDLAFGYANRAVGSEQFEVIIIAQGQTILAGRAEVSSIPAALRRQVVSSKDQLMTPTEVRYADGRPPVAGLAVGSLLTLPGTGNYEIYFIFPLNQEVATLQFLRSAAGTTGAILVILLTFIAALVARQVVTPVRAARRAAESLASGNLDDRMVVRGQDDLARLATSMNYMASELQKQITQLEDLSRVQQRFVSDVSHELRTPLTTVRMAAEVLYQARADFDAISARSAELMQTELDRFEALLTDLLEISRFDAGAAVLSLGQVDLVGLVQRVVDVHERFAEQAGIEVRIHAAGVCTAEVDARRIERIVRNLLVNAIEHGEAKPIDILIEGDEHAVAIAVRDHGVGFEASQARQVFHRFWRADPARTRTMGGTGLGLAISMEDANLHGGWLTAWGRPGLGAQFRLVVPRSAGTILQQSPLPLVPRDLVTGSTYARPELPRSDAPQGELTAGDPNPASAAPATVTFASAVAAAAAPSSAAPASDASSAATPVPASSPDELWPGGPPPAGRGGPAYDDDLVLGGPAAAGAMTADGQVADRAGPRRDTADRDGTDLNVANRDVANQDDLNPADLNPDDVNPDDLNPDDLNPDDLNPDDLGLQPGVPRPGMPRSGVPRSERAPDDASGLAADAGSVTGRGEA